MAPDELQGTVLEHADLLQKYAQANEKMVMYVGRQGLTARPPTPWTWDTLVRTVIAGQSLVWKTRTLALLDEEIIAIDVEAWVTLQTIAALRRVPGRRGKGRKEKGRQRAWQKDLGTGGKGWDKGKGPVGKGTDKGKIKGAVTHPGHRCGQTFSFCVANP